MNALFAEEMLILFAILALGSWIGHQSWRGLSLGAAGVLFVGMVFGHFGFQAPREAMELGLLLFVYAVGLQAGPRFFRTFRRHGLQYVAIAAAIAGSGALATLVVAYVLKLPYDLAAGLYTGALTCTPALAAVIDVIERAAPGASGAVSVGYGVAYPYSMIGVVLLIQFLPRLLRRSVKTEEQSWQQERSVETPELQARQFLITNPNCEGKKVSEINPHRMSLANISRVKRGERVFTAGPEVVLRLGDVVMVVGSPDEMEKMQMLLGEERHERMDVNSDVMSADVEVREESLTGKTLRQMRLWQRHTVVITRIRRSGLELAPNGNMTLEMGDTIRVVGEKASVEPFVKLVQGSPRKADETNMLPFLGGLLLGILLGSIPLNLPNGLQLRLGSAGGAFIVSLLVGHFGGLGPLKLYVPGGARVLARELGLMLFLAGAGLNAGGRFVQVIVEQGPALIFAGMAVTTLAALAGLLVMHGFYKMNLLATMGALCAGMTNPPGLGAANNQTETELPMLSYASVYPVALIFKILLAQLLTLLLQQIL